MTITLRRRNIHTPLSPGSHTRNRMQTPKIKNLEPNTVIMKHKGWHRKGGQELGNDSHELNML
jgi:hypothetical protein